MTMNLSEFTADDNDATSLDNQSRCVALQPTETVLATYYVMLYASVAVYTSTIVTFSSVLTIAVGGAWAPCAYISPLLPSNLFLYSVSPSNV